MFNIHTRLTHGHLLRGRIPLSALYDESNWHLSTSFVPNMWVIFFTVTSLSELFLFNNWFCYGNTIYHKIWMCCTWVFTRGKHFTIRINSLDRIKTRTKTNMSPVKILTRPATTKTKTSKGNVKIKMSYHSNYNSKEWRAWHWLPSFQDCILVSVRRSHAFSVPVGRSLASSVLVSVERSLASIVLVSVGRSLASSVLVLVGKSCALSIFVSVGRFRAHP